MRARVFLFCSLFNLSQGFGFSPNIPNRCSGALNLRRVQVMKPVEELSKFDSLHAPLRFFLGAILANCEKLKSLRKFPNTICGHDKKNLETSSRRPYEKRRSEREG